MITSNWHANCLMFFIDECSPKTRTSEGNYVKAEQRQHARYRMRDVELHIFSRGTQITGRLVNIGKGGLAFQFAPGPGKTAECRAIDILGPEPDRFYIGPESDRFYIAAIACRSIYDIGVLAEGRTFTGAETRLCGLQFIDLTDEQIQKLATLIGRYCLRLRTIP
jgi:hypothetical protein